MIGGVARNGHATAEARIKDLTEMQTGLIAIQGGVVRR
jgi:hypothetical protein